MYIIVLYNCIKSALGCITAGRPPCRMQSDRCSELVGELSTPTPPDPLCRMADGGIRRMSRRARRRRTMGPDGNPREPGDGNGADSRQGPLESRLGPCGDLTGPTYRGWCPEAAEGRRTVPGPRCGRPDAMGRLPTHGLGVERESPITMDGTWDPPWRGCPTLPRRTVDDESIGS